MESILVSLLLAAIGAFLAFTGGHLRRLARDRRLRRKFPVGGRFVSEFEDRSDGHSVTVKALSDLRQKGRQVTGSTINLSDGRGWVLRGSVEPGGFLHGLYEASDPHDSGAGTFFLKVEGVNGDMHGLWAGYDSVNGEIAGGRYVFRRCPEMTVRPASVADASLVCGLLGDALGDFYVDVETVRHAIADDQDATCLVAVDIHNHLIGAVTLHLVDKSSIAHFLPVGQEPLGSQLQILRFHEKVGLLRAIAVEAAHRGRGVATELTSAGATWCAEHGATAMLAFGWSAPDGCHISGVMDAAQFQEVTRVANFWTEDSKAKHYRCPACGPVCECGAVIYSRALGGLREAA